jgi:hypothetical protein
MPHIQTETWTLYHCTSAEQRLVGSVLLPPAITPSSLPSVQYKSRPLFAVPGGDAGTIYLANDHGQLCFMLTRSGAG